MVALIEYNVVQVNETTGGFETTNYTIRSRCISHVFILDVWKTDILQVELHLPLPRVFTLDTSLSGAKFLENPLLTSSFHLSLHFCPLVLVFGSSSPTG